MWEIFNPILAWLRDLLDNRITAARAALLDFLDASISSRAPASTAVSNAVATVARFGYLDKINSGGIPGTVKSIQRGTITVVGGASSVAYSATISAVDVNKSALTHLGQTNASSGWGDAYDNEENPLRIALTNSTTVQAWSNQFHESSNTVGWQVVEYY